MEKENTEMGEGEGRLEAVMNSIVDFYLIQFDTAVTFRAFIDNSKMLLLAIWVTLIK